MLNTSNDQAIILLVAGTVKELRERLIAHYYPPNAAAIFGNADDNAVPVEEEMD